MGVASTNLSFVSQDIISVDEISIKRTALICAPPIPRASVEKSRIGRYRALATTSGSPGRAFSPGDRPAEPEPTQSNQAGVSESDSW
jgi:hypothetical protein